MAFYGYNGQAGNCYWTPYSDDFAPAPFQGSSSPYEFGEPQLIEYNSSSQLSCSVCTCSEPKTLWYEPPEYHSSYNYYEYSVNPSEINYTEPKFLQYEPAPYDTGYFHSETNFTISYSASEFNEPEFEEYDPTPYGGGYDPAQTYGKPLPPSDSICYPKTVLPLSDNTSLENFPYASIPSPYGKDDDLPKNPPIKSKPVDSKTETHVKNGDKASSSDGSDAEIDDLPSYEHQDGLEDGAREGYGYESERRQVPHIPYGSGLEAVDLCESIFGYWPCLAKIEQQRRRRSERWEIWDQETRMDPWRSAADYLFGSSGVYDYQNYHHHHQQQQQQQQSQHEYYENS